MAELRKQARKIMQRWTHKELVSEVVDAGLLDESQAKSLDNTELAGYLERDMSDPEVAEFIEVSAGKSRHP